MIRTFLCINCYPEVGDEPWMCGLHKQTPAVGCEHECSAGEYDTYRWCAECLPPHLKELLTAPDPPAQPQEPTP